jgi:malate/lactate dehydrogenase
VYYEDGLVKGLKVGIVGIGRDSSVGFVLSGEIAKKGDLMDSLEYLLLNSRNETRVNHHVANNILMPLKEPLQGQCRQKIHYAPITRDGIEQKIPPMTDADVVFFCYESAFGASGFGYPANEPDGRKKLYEGNIETTKKMAEAFKDSKAQFVFVTNPALDLARAFQEHGGFEDGQVLGFNPDHYRLFKTLQSYGTYAAHIVEHIEKTFLVGDHGPLCGAFYPLGIKNIFVTDDRCKVTIEDVVDEVKALGPELTDEFDNSSWNIVEHMIDFISATIKNNGERFVWGAPHKFEYKDGEKSISDKIFMSLPVVNRIKQDENGKYVCRAEVCHDAIKDYSGTKGFTDLAKAISKSQDELQKNNHPALNSNAAVAMSENENIRICNYHTLRAKRKLSDTKNIHAKCGNRQLTCKSVVELMASSGCYLAAVTRGDDEGKKKVPKLMYWDFNPKAPERGGYVSLNSGMRFKALAIDGDRIYLESHARGGKNSSITVFKDGQIVGGPKEMKFISTAFAVQGSRLYCAAYGNGIRVLDKNTLDETGSIPKADLGRGTYFTELFVVNSGKDNPENDIICARTNQSRQDSTVYVWKNQQFKNRFTVSHNAFAAAGINGGMLMFYGAMQDGTNMLKTGFIEGEPAEKPCLLPPEVLFDSELECIGFDSLMNYLYVGASNKVLTIIPFLPRKGELLLKRSEQATLEERISKIAVVRT